MKTIYFLLLTLFSISISAQTKLSKKELDNLPNTLKNQFIKTYGKAKRWHEYKMITKADFQSLQKNALDSISSLKKDITLRQEKMNEQSQNISSLNKKMEELTNELQNSLGKENQISFLGININKTSYNLILWSAIGVLLLGMIFFIFRHKNSNILTKQAKKDLDEIEQEFESHRKKAIEKEQKLRRQLQDEINKQRGI